ncbi:MAG: hypothetical protein DIJKHBIC_04762 [Thermoanaerobaculia bacterium]|nr:hypothetical protein [Thermoanaerobaculia bacterium]
MKVHGSRRRGAAGSDDVGRHVVGPGGSRGRQNEVGHDDARGRSRGTDSQRGRRGIGVEHRRDLSVCRLTTRHRERGNGGDRRSHVRPAARELERADAQTPTDGARGRHVLVHVPEGAIVDGVDVHRCVVAPALAARLGTRSRDDHPFALRHGAEWVSREAARVLDAGIGGGTRGAVAECHVADPIHGDRAHPAVDPVSQAGGVRAFLVDHGRPVRVADLPPANPRHRGGGLDRLVGHDRLVGAEVTVSRAVQRALPVAEVVDFVRRTLLRHAGAAGTERRHRVVRRDRDRVGEDEARVGGRGEVRGELPDRQRVHGGAVRAAVVHRADEEVGGPGGGQRTAVEVRGQQAVSDIEGTAGRGRRDQERDHLRGRVSGDELRAVDGVGAHADEGAAALELACADVERVRPDAVLRVVGKVAARAEGVAVIAAGRVGRRRDGHAVVEGRARGGELGEDPAVGKLVMQHDGVTRVLRLTGAAEAGPQRVVERRAVQQRAGLAVDRKREVRHGHVVVRAHVAHRVGR